MTKNPKSERCIHCLGVFNNLTRDHVFPKSWYPDSTPTNLEKWKAPSCRNCNNELGAIEEKFLRIAGLCLDTGTQAGQGVASRVLRSMRPGDKKTNRENSVRESIRQKVISKAVEGKNIPSAGIIPGLHERWDRPSEEQIAFLIPADDIKRIAEKIIRGIYFIEDRKYIESNFSIDFFVLTPENGNAIQEELLGSTKTFSCGPGIVVRRTVAEDDGVTSVFEIEFWGQFKTYGSVTQED